MNCLYVCGRRMKDVLRDCIYQVQYDLEKTKIDRQNYDQDPQKQYNAFVTSTIQKTAILLLLSPSFNI